VTGVYAVEASTAVPALWTDATVPFRDVMPSADAGDAVIKALAAAMVNRPAAALVFFRTSSPCREKWHEPLTMSPLVIRCSFEYPAVTRREHNAQVTS
jgi:hypothetical protein